MSDKFSESSIEAFAIEALQSIGWEYAHGLSLAPESELSERESFEQIILTHRLQRAIKRINPGMPTHVCEQAVQRVLHIYSQDLLHNNESFQQLLIEKVKIPYQQDGFDRSHEVALIDFENPFNNEFLAVNQYIVVENNQNKRPDIVLFINGLPLVVMELKSAAHDQATIRKAYEQLQTYKSAIPILFIYNAVCVISDGLECKAGSVSAGFNRFSTWKSFDGRREASRFIPQLEILIKGMLNPATLLDLTHNFIVFEKTKKEDAKTGLSQIVTEKKLAAYHQYYAVNKAVASTISASTSNGNRKGGVVWHTTGVG